MILCNGWILSTITFDVEQLLQNFFLHYKLHHFCFHFKVTLACSLNPVCRMVPLKRLTCIQRVFLKMGSIRCEIGFQVGIFAVAAMFLDL
jgi:hypothetical protein